MLQLVALLLSLFLTQQSFCSTSIDKNESYLDELLLKRHSGRSFDPDKAVSSPDLIKLAKAAQTTPSSNNEQPWRFIFCDRQKTPEAYTNALKSLAENNYRWAKDAPVLILVLSQALFTRTKQPNRWSQFDTGAAEMSLLLKATSLGLMTHPMGGFDQIDLREKFAIPAEYVPMAIIAVGYESLNENMQPPQKNRQCLGENFFMGTWKNGLVE